MFFWEGLKKQCCRKTVPIKGFIESFLVVKKEEDNEFISNPDNSINNQTMRENEASKDIIFQTADKLKIDASN